MPDISKLPEIAELLEVSIDEILGKNNSLVNGLVSQPVEEFVEKNEVKPEELAEAAPILKPRQMNKLVKHCQAELELEELHEILPFLDTDTCGELLQKYAENDDKEAAASLLPFASREVIDQTALMLMRKGRIMEEFIVFMSPDVRDQMAWSVFEQYGVDHLGVFLPFISAELLNRVADAEFQARGLSQVAALAPFMVKEHLEELARQAIRKDGLGAIRPIAPFLNRDLYQQYVKEAFL